MFSAVPASAVNILQLFARRGVQDRCGGASRRGAVKQLEAQLGASFKNAFFPALAPELPLSND